MISRLLARTLLAGLTVGAFEFSSLGSGSTSHNCITLSWDPSTDPTVIGYRLYVGGSSQFYTNVTDVGGEATATISTLAIGGTYYFNVTSYDGSGLESAFSGEISYSLPSIAPGPPLMLGGMSVTQNSLGEQNLSGTGPPGSICEVWATRDLVSWSVVGTVTIGATGVFQFADPDSVLLPNRFYRLGIGTWNSTTNGAGNPSPGS